MIARVVDVLGSIKHQPSSCACPRTHCYISRASVVARRGRERRTALALAEARSACCRRAVRGVDRRCSANPNDARAPRGVRLDLRAAVPRSVLMRAAGAARRGWTLDRRTYSPSRGGTSTDDERRARLRALLLGSPAYAGRRAAPPRHAGVTVKRAWSVLEVSQILSLLLPTAHAPSVRSVMHVCSGGADAKRRRGLTRRERIVLVRVGCNRLHALLKDGTVSRVRIVQPHVTLLQNRRRPHLVVRLRVAPTINKTPHAVR